IWHMVKAAAKRAEIENLAPHDFRRSCTRLCHLAGGELEQIQVLLGHASVQTTERHLGCQQNLREALNDNLCLEGSGWLGKPRKPSPAQRQVSFAKNRRCDPVPAFG